MVDAIRQIRQDIKTLTQAIATLATELDVAYDDYLMALRISLEKQVVLACYHLCTHSYPEPFLRLSFAQREAFQQAIQTHIRQAQQRLMNAYVLATTIPKQSEADKPKGKKWRRSLPSSDHPLARSRRRPKDDDDDGPSIEFIAIGGDMDDDDMMAIANDPALAAALSELADNLSLDRGEVAERIKRELIHKISDAESGEADALDDDDEENFWVDSEDSDSAPDSASASASAPDSASASASASAPDSDSVLDSSSDSDSGQNADQNAAQNADVQSLSGVTQTASVSSKSASPVGVNQTPDHSEASLDNPLLNDSRNSDASEISEPSESTTAVSHTKFAAGDMDLPPTELLFRQACLEQNVAGVLRDLSKQVNHQLHQAGMIPKKLPGAVLEAALQSDASAEPSSGPPNVLNLLVEVEDKSKSSSKNSKMLRVKAIRLRASGLEFSDPHLSACRSRLRERISQLRNMGKTYEQKQRSRAIAEAEAAWRSSWYERED